MAAVDAKFLEFRGEQVQFWLLRYAVGAVTWRSSPTIEPTPLLWRAFWGRKEVFVYGPPVFLLAKALKVVPQFMYAGHGAMVPVLFLRDAAESVWHGGVPTVAERGV